MQEKEKLTLAKSDVKNDEDNVEVLEGFDDNNENIPTDPKYVVQFWKMISWTINSKFV